MEKTAKDVAQLPAGRELDAEIAQAMGYRELRGHSMISKIFPGLKESDYPHTKKIWAKNKRDYFCEECGDLPDYTTGGEGMLMMLEWLQTQIPSIELYYETFRQDTEKWHCALRWNDAPSIERPNHQLVSYAPTAQLAVARAILAWHKTKESHNTKGEQG